MVALGMVFQEFGEPFLGQPEELLVLPERVVSVEAYCREGSHAALIARAADAGKCR
jgi:hypothetical protein